MATLYLHIGLPKTGTTSLQHFLSENRSVLEKYRISYPDVGFRYVHALPQRNGHFLLASYTEASKDGKESPGAEYLAGLDQIASMASDFDKIILSDESLWRNTPRFPNFWPNLKAELKKRNLDIRIVVYLRRQDLWVQSMWGQIVKMETTLDFQSFLDSDYCMPTDYYAYLEFLSSFFGKDAMIVRLYENSQYRGKEKNIFSDFLDIFGLTIQDGFQVDEYNYNRSLNGSCLELRRRLNHFSGMRDSTLLRKSIKEVYDNNLAADASLKGTWFLPGEQQAYLDTFSESNGKVALEYLGRKDRILFREPVEDLPTYEVSSEDLLDDAILAYGRAFQVLEKENIKLKKELSKIQGDLAKMKKDVSTIKKNTSNQSGLLHRIKRIVKKLIGR